ncbi:phosphotransferase [Streptomyces rubellomurinus]|uniref:phosphotransferase n=1 Tax=Streptomyces rubellomurinus (strain ATCC 31215) TaxID=359131 RepID=UPI00099C200E|nr:phosphotransferase [Streptomyces rubellomurinus]
MDTPAQTAATEAPDPTPRAGGRIDVDADTVRALLREQHPDLAELTLRRVEGGWGHRMWRLGEEHVLRMPRDQDTPVSLRKELRWLPELAPRLPLPVPEPRRTGGPGAGYPYRWAVLSWVPGDPADRTPIAIEHGPRSAEVLADFLLALHRPAPADAPGAGARGGPLAPVTPDFERRLAAFEEQLHELAPGIRAEELRAVWEDAVAAPVWAGPPVWLHADLHPANVVVVDGALGGIVDFDALGAGDPAGDLAAAWLLLPAGADRPCLERWLAAQPADERDAAEATVRRARGWAVLRALMLLGIGRAGLHGLPGGKPTWGPAGRAALQRVLAHFRRAGGAG